MKYLITSALPYINGIKHLGNLVGSMLPADVYSRFLRQNGKEVLYICGTDDHGTPAEISAKQANMTTADFCDIQFEKQKIIYENFGISFDFFGRTSREQTKQITQEIGKQLYKNGFFEIRTIKQIYSIEDGRFLSDRYITGTCPHCGYEMARGDQCENCTKLLDPTDLINPRSSISGSTKLETRESKHLFLLQSNLKDRLREWIDGNNAWSQLVKSIAYKWLDEGLEDRCMTRDLDWGTPVVGIEGLENKVYYVWFDAPIGYAGITKEWADANNTDWKSWWHDTKNVHLTQFMAKDNIPFHAISFPATLIAANDNIKLVDDIKGFNWLTYYGGKFSTSQQRGIFTDTALDLLPADYWRYYLMFRIPEGSDSSFTWQDLQALINKDLIGVLGNFVSRVLKFTEKEFSNIAPSCTKITQKENILIANLGDAIKTYNLNMEIKEFRKAMSSLRFIWVLGNEYIASSEPWKVIKEDRLYAETIMNISINLIRIFAILSKPIIPFSAKKILDMLNISDFSGWIDCDNILSEISFIKEKHPLNQNYILFKRIENEEISDFIQRFG